MSKILKFNKKDKDDAIPSSFFLKEKDKKYAELVLYGDIGESFWGDGVTLLDVSNALKEFGAIDKLDIRLNSFGGSVFEGIAIYNRIKQLKADKTVYIDGIAASIASIIALAGDKVVAGEGAHLMIHKPWTYASGNSSELEATIHTLDSIEEEMISIYSRKTKLGRTELKNLLSKETWLRGQALVDYGFADEVIEGVEAVATGRGRVDVFSSIYRNVPKSEIVTESKQVKNRIKDLNKDIEGFLARK